MGDTTAISWADHTFNPWEGCTRLSPACENCYAADRAHRFGNDHLWAGQLRRTSPANWRKPLAWNWAATAAGTRPRVFCASLADVFDNKAPQEWREDLWRLIEATPNLIWMLLTKRPQNVGKMLSRTWCPAIRGGHLVRPGPTNIWLGTTAEDQERADQRLAFTASIAGNLGWLWFVSAEPLLAALDLTSVAIPGTQPGRFNPLKGSVAYAAHHHRPQGLMLGRMSYPPCGLVITGGESGRKARPSNPAWFRSLRDQCAGAGVPFHFKQWGEWQARDRLADGSDLRLVALTEHAGPDQTAMWPDGHVGYGHADQHGGAGVKMLRVGKERAGRLLDGVEHLGMPA